VRNVRFKLNIVLHRRSECDEGTDRTLRSLPQRSRREPASPPYSLGRILAGMMFRRLSEPPLCTCVWGEKTRHISALCQVIVLDALSRKVLPSSPVLDLMCVVLYRGEISLISGYSTA
jgi:hypothetical protein